MAIPIHTVNIFDRPKEGNHFMRRVVAYNYQHSIAAYGWYDTMSCDVAVRSQQEGMEYLDRFLGCRVFAYADDSYIPMWEGLINRITFNSGNVSYTISLDEMANRVTVKYSNDSVTANGTGTQSETAVANSTGSQNIYGIKQSTLEFGYNRNGNTGHVNALRDTILAKRAFPQTSITQGGQNSNLVTLECIGFFHTLEWEMFSISTTTTTQFNTRIINDVLPAVGNGTTFFDNTNTGAIATNATATTGTSRNGSLWDYILKIAEGGDATNYWIAGIEPTNPQTGTRRLYYRQANSSVEYTARTRDGLRIRDLYGRIVLPWMVRPDRVIRVTDVLVGFNSAVTTDPRETYIYTTHYDANSQQVTYAGIDDTTAQAAFMLKRGFKPYARAFGMSIKQAAN